VSYTLTHRFSRRAEMAASLGGAGRLAKRIIVVWRLFGKSEP
jgi:hypothetical protein